MTIRKRKQGILTVILALMFFMFASNTFAGTICISPCLDPATNGQPALPQILEIFSPDGSPLTLENNGLIILDRNIFDNVSGLMIDTSTPIYNGLGELPGSITIPDILELNTLSYLGGSLTLNGLLSDFVLLRQFDGNSVLNLTATDGVLVLNTNSLFAVPSPASILLMFGGILVMVPFLRRKKLAIKQ